jgi:thiol:disulfide interchange protein DsbD
MRLFTLLTLLTIAAPALAEPGPVQRPHIEVELLAEVESVQPGEPFRVGLRMQPDAHWHTYWKNPGDSGLATELEWRLPEGASASDIQWPYPERVPMGELVNYGYGGEHLLPATVSPPADLQPGERFAVALSAEWLVCETICIPGEAELSLSLPVRAGTPAIADEHRALFDWADARRPESVDWPARYDTAGDQLSLQIESSQLSADGDWTVFVGSENVVDHARAARWAAADGVFQAGQPLSPFFAGAPDPMPVVIVDDSSGQAFEVMAEAAALQSTAAAAPAGGSPPVGWGLAIVLALAGGVLLNLMPCVFPVLSIKAMSLVAAGGSQRAHGLAYTAGVMVSFAALAGVLLALRAGGEAIGWGFQLQSPWVVGLLVYVLFALALSLSGLFSFGNRLMGFGQGLTERAGASGSFFTGVLACIVASPCTAPFMGTALGAAVVMPWPMALSIFLALGLGLALPMLVLGFSPALARRLPKPGSWMETFKQLMAFPLYLAVVWLLWVLGSQIGADGIAAVLTGLVVLAFAAWLGGRRDRSPTAGTLRHTAVALSLIAAAAALGAGVRDSAVPAEAGESAGWERYSPERLAQLRDDPRQAVLVNMTADWCVTCLVNERVALSTEAVREAMAEHAVTYMKGDWTRRDEAITEYLAQFDRNGVPLYVLYPHDGGEPRVLPQVLSPGLVVDAIESL